MKYELFDSILLRDNGCALSIKIAENNPLFYDMLNLLCGAKPHKWIGSGAHNKIIRLDNEFSNKLIELLNRYLKGPEYRKQINVFFDGIKYDKFLAFLRRGTLCTVDDNLINTAISMLRTCNVDDSYIVNVFGDQAQKQYTGPSNLRNCICRFCQNPWPVVSFAKGNAHAIPDALGNKLVFCNDECTKCNHELNDVEKNLIYYLNFRRADAKIPGKRGKIITTTGQNYSLVGKTGHIEISEEAILKKNGEELEVKHLDAKLITHLGIYRALSKIAIDLMPNEQLKDFQTTIDWIRGTVSPHTVPDVYFAYRKNSVVQPIARVYMRKKDADASRYPHCMVSLDLIDLRFYYIVPFAKSDGRYFLTHSAIENYMPFLTSLDNENRAYDHID